MPSLGQKLKKLNRRYKLITKYRYLYNKPPELTRKYNKVDLYLLLHAEFGYSLMRITTRHRPITPLAWWAYIKSDWVSEAWPKVQEHLAGGGGTYQFVDVVGFAGVAGVIQKSGNSKAFNKRRKRK